MPGSARRAFAGLTRLVQPAGASPEEATRPAMSHLTTCCSAVLKKSPACTSGYAAPIADLQQPAARRRSRRKPTTGRPSIGLEETVVPPLQHKAGESPGKDGAGVDVDAVRQDFGLGDRRMAVDDDDAVIGAAQKELVPYPDEVVRRLAVEGDTRANAGVAEEVVAEARRPFQAFDERAMRCRQHFDELAREVCVVADEHGEEADLDAIGGKGRVAAIGHEGRTHVVRVDQEIEEHLVVIAAKADDARIAGSQPGQPLDDR